MKGRDVRAHRHEGEALTLMAVHAHPDDEAISTGGVLARYADEGLRTVLVTCTGGEVGEISDSMLATPETLAEVRRRELRAPSLRPRSWAIGHPAPRAAPPLEPQAQREA